jgi:hypothetical protein
MKKKRIITPDPQAVHEDLEKAFTFIKENDIA